MDRHPRHVNRRAAETLQITCTFPPQVRAGLWRVVVNLTATLMLVAMALMMLAVLAPQRLDAQIMGEPLRHLEVAEEARHVL
jgi:hypothetical protein